MQDLADATRIRPGSKVDLGDHPPNAKLGLRDEKSARAQTAKRIERMGELATMLMAEHRRAVLVVLQGMDASGKDGTVKHCLGGLNPMSVRVAGFKAPNSTELAHDFLWRIHQVLPQRGEIGDLQSLALRGRARRAGRGARPEAIWKKRYAAINAFEQQLASEGTIVVKLFLHISREEQAARFRERLAERPQELEVLGPTTSRSAGSGTSTWRPIARWSSAPRPTSRRGTSCPPTTSGCATRSSPRS